MGVKRINVPVINPDLVAVVNFKPMVCVEKPRKYINPRNTPLNKAVLEMFLHFFRKKGSRIIVANENRIEIKTIGETFISASFIIANVAPQINVIIRRISSAEYFFIWLILFYSLSLI
jgi:hypothetical protein